MDGIQNIDIGGYNFEINDETKKLLELQLQSFSECINQMKEGDDWRNYQGILSHAFRSVYKELHADHETGAADNK